MLNTPEHVHEEVKNYTFFREGGGNFANVMGDQLYIAMYF